MFAAYLQEPVAHFSFQLLSRKSTHILHSKACLIEKAFEALETTSRIVRLSTANYTFLLKWHPTHNGFGTLRYNSLKLFYIVYNRKTRFVLHFLASMEACLFKKNWKRWNVSICILEGRKHEKMVREKLKSSCLQALVWS